MRDSKGIDYCELCTRNNLKLTFHHLIPKKMHKKKYVLKIHPNKDFNKYGIVVCVACHKTIHNCISHKDLALRYFTITDLLSHSEIKKAVEFNSKQEKRKVPR